MSRVISKYGFAARGAGISTSACLRVFGALALIGAAMFGTATDGRAQGLEWTSTNGLRAIEREQTLTAPRKLGAAVRPSPRPVKQVRKRKSSTVQKAAYIPDTKPAAPSGSLSGGVRWVANSGCLASNLRGVIAHLAANFGHVTVNSTCRSHRHNRRVGGAPRSHHLTGNAADVRIRGNVRGALAYLRGSVGGLKHYGGGLFHIDNGPKRRF